MQSNIRKLRSDKHSLILSVYEVSGIKMFNEYKSEFDKLKQNFTKEISVYIIIIIIYVFYRILKIELNQ